MEYPFCLLTEYFVRENYIDMSKSYEICTMAAKDLFGPNRFDLLAKWVYIDAREKKLEMEWAIDLYRDNINAFSCGLFVEPGTEEKNSFQRYLEQFEQLIDDIKENGFDSRKSLVPVGENNVLLDGSHRVATAAYFNCEVTVIKFPGLTRKYDYKYFRQYLMSDINMGYMAMYYAHIMPNCYMACVWPVVDLMKFSEVEMKIREIGDIVYVQDVYLTYQGMKNFMIQIYGHQDWVGNLEDHFRGIYGKVNACYKKKQAVRTILFEAKSFDKVVSIKNIIRNILGLGNHSIHISDNQEETKFMSDLLYNANSVNFMNNAITDRYHNVYNNFSFFKHVIEEGGYDKGRFLIASEIVLGICGLRNVGNIKFLTDYEISDLAESIEVDNFICQRESDFGNVRDLLYNPKCYFFYGEMKFLTLEKMLKTKRGIAEIKGVKAMRLSKKFIRQYNYIPINYRQDIKEKISDYQQKRSDYGHGLYSVEEYFRLELHEPIQKTRQFLGKFKIRNIVKRLRWEYILFKRKKIKNKNVSIISSNCNGGIISHDLGLEYKSPFVNLFIKADDYIKMLSDLKGYLNEELCFIKEKDDFYGEVSYPTAYLRDIKIYFMHYMSEEEAFAAWERRKKRINWDNIYIIMTDRSGCTQKDLEDFDKLPYKHKVVFTHIRHPEIKSSYYIHGYENEEKVGVLSQYRSDYSIRRQLDQFDFVKWFNTGKIIRNKRGISKFV